MDSQIAYLVTYPCPRCGVSLEAHTDDWQDWLQCPSCGRAGRPPFSRRVGRPVEDDILYIGTFATGHGSVQSEGNDSAIGYAPSGRVGYQSQPNHARRVLIGGGFFLAVVLAVVSVVQQNGTQAGVLAMVAVFMLILLARSSGRD